MNIARYIARRITFQQQQSFTKVIINIGITAVALSVMVLIIASSLFRGFKSEISDKVYGFWGHIHVSDANVKRTFETIPFQYDSTLVENIRNIEHIEYDYQHKVEKSRGGVQAIYPYIVTPSLIEADQELEGIILRGINEEFKNKIFHDFISDGNFLTLMDKKREILISSLTSERLQLKVGDSLMVSFFNNENQVRRKLGVCGIYNTGIEEYDKQFALVHLELIQEALNWPKDKIAGYEILIENLKDIDIINEYIYVEELPSRLYSETINEKFPAIFGWLDIQNINERVLFIMMIIVSIITMITTYLILILERTHTIGILKSLGASNQSVIKIFLHCAGYIIIRGILIGDILGIFLCFIQKNYKIIKLDESNYLLDTAPIIYDWSMYLFINIGIIIITLLFLLIPSFIITKISPTQILKFD